MSSPYSCFQPLPIHQLEEIYREVQKSENAASLIDDVRNLVEWLKIQPHLQHIEFSQSFLLSILLIQKGLEKAKKHLEFHYTARAVYPEYFVNWDPATIEFRNAYNSCHLFPGKVLTSDGNLMVFLGFGNTRNGSLPNTRDMFEEGSMVVTFQEYYSPCKSGIVIIDCKGITSHFIQLILVGLPKLVPLFMKVNSVRLSKIYVLYEFPMLATIVSLVKKIPILKKKIGDRIEIWNRNADELVDVLPAECLPRDYGGSCPSINEQKEQFYEYMLQNRDWFMTECQKKARLDLRPKTIDNEDDPFGFGADGTFRKLSID